jgi:hypothetical protein
LRIIDVETGDEIGAFRSQVFPSGDTKWQVALVGDFALMATGERSLRLLNVSDPSSPKQAQFLSMPTEVGEILVRDDLAYVSGRRGGLYTLKLSIPETSAEAHRSFIPITTKRW